MEGSGVPEIQSIMVFLNDQVVIEPGEASIRAIKLKQLKGFIRETAKQRKLTSAQVQDLNHALEVQ